MFYVPVKFDSHKCQNVFKKKRKDDEQLEEPFPKRLKDYADRYNVLQAKNDKKMEVLVKRINLLSATKEDKKMNPSHDCVVCSRKFVHEAGKDRHLDKHIGEIMPPSGVEENIQLACRCACGELFLEDEDAFQHVSNCHIQEDDEVKSEVDSVAPTGNNLEIFNFEAEARKYLNVR